MHSPNALFEHDSSTETVISSSKDTALKAVQVGRDAAKSISHILSWEDLPQWMQSDPYIRSGYRGQLDSFGACFRSIFYLHNESVNIWSHIIPTCCYLAVLLATDYSILHNGVQLSSADNTVIQTYVAGSIVCLVFSAGFHTVTAHSEQVATRFLKLDYLGILLNVAACATTFIYAGFHGKPSLQALYISLFVVNSALVFSAILSPLADGPQAAVWRSSLFVGLSASGLAPMVHAVVLDGPAGLHAFPLRSWCIMALFYLAGMSVYIARVPEKFAPGRFDIWGASHQIFHILVPFGQVVYFLGLRDVILSHY